MNGIDTEALSATLDAVGRDPGLADVTFGLESEWLDGCHQRASTTDLRQNGEVVETHTTRYTMESDEPAALLGTDKAASPAEYVLQALAGCYAVTFAANAAARGIELDSLRLDMRADLDLHGFLGLDESVRPGVQEVRVDVHATSSNSSREQLQELTDAVQQRSPIRDTLASAVTVKTILVGG
ncbi:OsmC family protein [Janibacter sp. GS2]|uniref:OsmC family protein n=1 Tax=Janibacter sp. GS2 TaxID=3442646 RepID=UPI003EC0BA21